jgi:diguanylate cyclase (GGDEF)-like protein
MAVSSILTVGVDRQALADLTRQLGRLAPGVPIESLDSHEELSELALADPGCVLVLPFRSQGIAGAEALRRLRGRGILTPAILLLPAGEMRQGLDVRGLGAVDFLALEGWTAFDLQRALLVLETSRVLFQRAVESEMRAREVDEARERLQHDVDGLGRRLAALETVDPTTGLRTERYMVSRVEEALALARRYDAPVSCLLVGVDGLEKVRAGGGADAADRLLAAVASRLKESVREADLVARHGREEFLVLCPFTTPDEAVELAQRLREAAAAAPVALPAGPCVPALSVGIAGCRPDVVRAIEVIQTAAEALQQARDLGGQRVRAL